jgi:ribose transport system permease protein
MRKELGTFVLLVVLCIALAILNPSFLASANLQNLARLIGIYGIFSIGLGLVIITGGIDLSVGSVFALLGVLLSIFLVDWHLPAAIAVIGVIAISTSLGLINGFLITKVKIQAFIVTLCGLLFYRGLARFIANDETKGFGSAQGFETLQSMATGSVLGVPTPFIILVVISVLMWVVIHRSVYGRYLFAVGRNEVAARYSGINADLITASAYVVCGLLAGIAGILLAFYTNSISPSSHGNFYELYGIAAGGARRMQSARRRRIDHRNLDRHGVASGLAEPRKSVGHSKLVEFCRDGSRDPDRSRRRPTSTSAKDGEDDGVVEPLCDFSFCYSSSYQRFPLVRKPARSSFGKPALRMQRAANLRTFLQSHRIRHRRKRRREPRSSSYQAVAILTFPRSRKAATSRVG